MQINKTVEKEKEVVKVIGRLDSLTSPELEEELKGQLEEIKELEFDFSELEYISSAGLRILLSTLKEMNHKGGKMYLTGCNEMILEIFDVTGFSDILTINK